jgi:hypothetical protein
MGFESSTTTFKMLYSATFYAKLFEAILSPKPIVLPVFTDGLVEGVKGPGDVDDHAMWHVVVKSIRMIRQAGKATTGELTIYFCCGEDDRFGGQYGRQPWIQKWNDSLVGTSIKVCFGTVEMLAEAARTTEVAKVLLNFAPMTKPMQELVERFGITHVMGQGGITLVKDKNGVVKEEVGYNLKDLSPTLQEGVLVDEAYSACKIRVGNSSLDYLGVKTGMTAFTFPRSAKFFENLSEYMPHGWLDATLAMGTVKQVALPPKKIFPILFKNGMRNLFWAFIKALIGAMLPPRRKFELAPEMPKLVPEGSTLNEAYAELIGQMPTLEEFYAEYMKSEGEASEPFADEGAFSSSDIAKVLCLIYGKVIAPRAFGANRYEAILKETSPFSFSVADAFGGLVLANTDPDAQTSPMYDAVAAMLLLGPIFDPEFAGTVGTVALNGGPAPASLVDYFDRFFARFAEMADEGPGRLMSSV